MEKKKSKKERSEEEKEKPKKKQPKEEAGFQPTPKISAKKPIDFLSLFSYPKLPNPGKYEDINKEAKNILSMNELFDGFRYELNRGIADGFQVSHSFSLGSSMEPASYNFGVFWCPIPSVQNEFSLQPITEQPEPQAPKTWVNARADTDKHVMIRGQHIFTDRFKLTIGSQLVSEPHQSTINAETEYRGSNFSVQTKWANPGLYGISYLQSITKNLAFGGDLYYNYKQKMAVATLGGKVYNDTECFSSVFTYGHITLGYSRRLSDRLTLATELAYQMGQQGAGWDSTWTAGYEFSFRTVNVKACISSAWKVMLVYTQMLSPYMSINLAGELDHDKKQYKFGIGFQSQM